MGGGDFLNRKNVRHWGEGEDLHLLSILRWDLGRGGERGGGKHLAQLRMQLDGVTMKER